MSSRSTFSTGLVSVLCVAAIIGGLYFFSSQKSNAEEGAPSAAPTETATDHGHDHDHAEPASAESGKAINHPLTQLQESEPFLGKAEAPVTIVEYSSMSCPHCAAFHKELLPALTKKYIDTGVVKFTNRHFPLNEPALRAGMLTKCVGNDQYFKFTGVLFDLQDKWAFAPTFLEDLQKIATVGGVSPEKFNECMEDKTLETTLITSRQEASDVLNVNATPTFFINGIELKGHLSPEAFDAAIAVAQQGKPAAQ